MPYLAWRTAKALPSDIDLLLAHIQNELFDVGAELATPNAQAKHSATLNSGSIAALESAIDQHESQLAPLRQFILPGGTAGGAFASGTDGLSPCRAATGHLDRERVDFAGAGDLLESLE